MVSFGLLSAFTAATYQIISYFRRTGVFSGVPLAIGLIILLIFSVLNTLKDIISLENQKYEAMMANEAKGRFLANMSHEIRTPINAFLGMNAMVLRESTESNIREYALDIQAAGQNLLSIITDTPIIALTANAISGAKEMYLSEGFDDFLSKPIIPEKLESMLAKYLPKNKVIETVIKGKTDQSVSGIITELEARSEFNLEYARILNHKPEYLVEVFRDFYEMADVEANCLQRYYDAIFEGESDDNSDTSVLEPDIANAWRQYCIKVHSMKSSAALIGAMGLSGMALTLKKAANEGNVTVIKQISPFFLNEWNRYKEIISECLGTENDESNNGDDLFDERDLVSEDDLTDEGDLVSEDDLIDEDDLISEADLVE